MKNAKRALNLLRSNLLVIDPLEQVYATLAGEETVANKIRAVGSIITKLAQTEDNGAIGASPCKLIQTVRTSIILVGLGYPNEARALQDLNTLYCPTATDPVVFSQGCLLGLVSMMSELFQAGEEISPELEEAVAKGSLLLIGIGSAFGFSQMLKEQGVEKIFQDFVLPAKAGKDGQWGRAESINFILATIKADRKRFGVLGEEVGQLLYTILLANLERHMAWQTAHFALGLMMRSRVGKTEPVAKVEKKKKK